MNKSKVVGGIDIGSAKISTLIAQVNEEITGTNPTVNIIGASSVASGGVRKGQIVDIEEAVEKVTLSVEAAERMAGYNLESAYLAIGGAHISSLNSHGVVAVSDPSGEISPADEERVIEAAKAISLPSSREIIHVLPREFVVDGESGVRDPIGMTGVRLEVETHLVTVSSSAVKNIAKTVSEVGVDIKELVFSAYASSISVLTETEKELGVVLVDIGGGVTSIAAYIDGSLCYSGAIPIGAKNVTNDLAIGLKVSLEDAEKIKIALSEKKAKEESDVVDIKEMGLSESKKVSKKTLIEGIIRPRLNEIFTIVRLELEKVGISNRVPSGVVVTGGGALTVGAADVAKRTLSLPARVGNPMGVAGLIDEIMVPQFAAAIGLILYGAKLEERDESRMFGNKFKFPTSGMFGKIVEAIKDLLP